MSERFKIDFGDEDLIKQDLNFQKSGEEPAAKVIRNSKRKCENGMESQDDLESREVLRSRFANTHKGGKKTKENLLDFTLLEEAVTKENIKGCVLGKVVERDVTLSSTRLATWNPPASPHGFPLVTKICSQEEPDVWKGKSRERSLYMQQFENREKTEQLMAVGNVVNQDDYILTLGGQSYIVDGKSGLGNYEEAENIHAENIALLSKMRHQERLKEKEEISSQLSPEQLKFILSMRKCKRSNIASANDIEERLELQTPRDQIMKDPMAQDIKGKKQHVLATPMEDLDINVAIPSEAKKFINMNKIEYQKLQWTTDAPKVRPLTNNEGFVARFDFEGNLLPYDADVPFWEGLMHHGEEPGRAGYSVDELFLFVRSKVTQQRHLGLKTVANILRNAKEGLYDECFQSSLIQLMVDAGLVLLLRFALDESTALVYQEAIRATYYLIYNESDEKCLDLLELCMTPFLRPGMSSKTYSNAKDRKELNEEVKELKDFEVIQLDVIRALMKMDIHLRLRYLLGNVSLSPPDVIHILGILKRIASHSLTTAWVLCSTPQLLSVITENFLPHNTSPLLGVTVERVTSVYGIPLRHALSFLKVLAAQGREIANLLVSKYDLMSNILAYVSLEPSDTTLPQSEALGLAVEAYGLWTVFLSYGLVDSQRGFASFYPLIVKQLVFYRDKIDINDEVEANHFNYDVGSSLINVITKALGVAATASLLALRMNNMEPTTGKDILQPPLLSWEAFAPFLTLVQDCLRKWMCQLLRNPVMSWPARTMVGSFFNFLHLYYSNWKDQRAFDGIKSTIAAEELYDSLIRPFVQSPVSATFLANLRTHSSLSCSLELGSERDSKNLSSLACVCRGGQIIPTLQNNSSFQLMLPMFSFLVALLKFYPALDREPISLLLKQKDLILYLNELCSRKKPLKGHWMTRIEVMTLCRILELGGLANPHPNTHLYHKVAISILPLIHRGDEALIPTLLSSIICHPTFVKDISGLESQMNIMSFHDYVPLKSPATQQTNLSPLELTERVIQSIALIGSDMTVNLLDSKALEVSDVRQRSIPFMINGLTQQESEHSVVLSNYWYLSAVKRLYATKKEISTEGVMSVTRCLQITYLLLRYHKDIVRETCNPTGLLRHLSLVFLISNDLFLNNQIRSYNEMCIYFVLQDENYKRFDWSLTFADLPFSYDWYKEMVLQYGSVSYGDETFALFLIIPLQRYCPSDYKILLFGEHSEELIFIGLTKEKVSQYIPIESFLQPPEDNEQVLAKYKSAIEEGSVKRDRCPFLYELATHHVIQSAIQIKRT